MTNIKIVYFDSVSLDAVTFEGRLRSLCNSIYVIKEGLIVVNYNGSSKSLFDSLFPDSPLGNVLVIDLDTTAGSYWGFMNKDFWTWLNNNH